MKLTNDEKILLIRSCTLDIERIWYEVDSDISSIRRQIKKTEDIVKRIEEIQSA